MKKVTVRCGHTPKRLVLEVAEEDIHYIQCQLIQVRLSPEQARAVCGHCDCMAPQMWFDAEGGGACMTIDPSQLDLRGKTVVIQPVG
ncbi:MAG: hypothetical protein QM330_10740 [Acidobacteriota bacterium]|mgnify:CR=1 FL=1|nr:hypothetical protein [Acidobacteriota bacterium]NLT33443.1 hypothetical protein [Acidobacteriota bacterium]